MHHWFYQWYKPNRKLGIEEIAENNIVKITLSRLVIDQKNQINNQAKQGRKMRKTLER
jgi:hypothetical protein